MSERIESILHGIRFGGRQPCCGATNPCCGRPPGILVDSLTGCQKCGHSKGCHAWTWQYA